MIDDVGVEDVREGSGGEFEVTVTCLAWQGGLLTRVLDIFPGGEASELFGADEDMATSSHQSSGTDTSKRARWTRLGALYGFNDDLMAYMAFAGVRVDDFILFEAFVVHRISHWTQFLDHGHLSAKLLGDWGIPYGLAMDLMARAPGFGVLVEARVSHHLLFGDCCCRGVCLQWPPCYHKPVCPCDKRRASAEI